ncbi:MAG: DUF2098 family protein [Methanobacteriaceae archaeon]|nr:DUF2098 family protein [Methanobacteriaceae archaeon]
MDAKDLREKIIEKGSIVRYIGTNTIGKADKILEKDSQIWIRIDSSGLFYRSDYLELLKEEELPQKKSFQKSIKEKVLISKNLKRVAPTQISDHGDGPGYGGG